ncbi:hypothetical protein MXB_5535, partial [Myxobolus squamalis]
MSFQIQAPGKLVITGEHSSVYGRSALLTSINLFTTFSYTLNSEKTIKITAHKDIKSFVTFELKSLDLQHEEFYCRDFNNPCLPAKHIIDQLKHQMLEKNPDLSNFPSTEIYLAFILGVFMGIQPSKIVDLGFDIDITSDIPISCGLGSSAAFSSCLATLILIINGSIRTKELGNYLNLVNKWAYQFECIFHGKPSGMDNACSVFGGLMVYKNGLFTKLDQHRLNDAIFVVIETGKKKSTANMCKNVSSLLENYPISTNFLFDTINS